MILFTLNLWINLKPLCFTKRSGQKEAVADWVAVFHIHCCSQPYDACMKILLSFNYTFFLYAPQRSNSSPSPQQASFLIIHNPWACDIIYISFHIIVSYVPYQVSVIGSQSLVFLSHDYNGKRTSGSSWRQIIVTNLG